MSDSQNKVISVTEGSPKAHQPSKAGVILDICGIKSHGLREGRRAEEVSVKSMNLRVELD